jgi:hypothetical protein
VEGWKGTSKVTRSFNFWFSRAACKLRTYLQVTVESIHIPGSFDTAVGTGAGNVNDSDLVRWVEWD